MKKLIAALPLLVLVHANAAEPVASSAPAPAGIHRYVIERTFPAGALAGLDATAKANVNATNARFGVQWVMSYSNAEMTKTYCIYNGPNETAVRDAAKANGIPVDSVMEVPVTLLPQ